MTIRIAMIFLLLSGSAFSQAKVGTTGGDFLSLATSVRSAGMADIGVMLTDYDAFYYNPAVISLKSDRGRYHLPLTVTPDMRGTDVDYFAAGMVRRPIVKSRGGIPSIGIGVDVTYLRSGSMTERTYDRGPDYPGEELFGTGETFTWKDVKVGANIGLGWSGQVDFAVGVAVNWIGEYVHDYNANSWSVDPGAYLGILLGIPEDGSWQPRRLSFGLSYSNLGPDLKFIEKAAPMPKVLRFGAALELASIANGRTRFGLLPVIEYELCTTDEVGAMKFGLELSYRELVSGRVGHRTTKDEIGNKQTYGISLSTLGLRSSNDSSQSAGFFRSLIYAVIFDLHYARVIPEANYLPGTNLFGFSLTF